MQLGRFRRLTAMQRLVFLMFDLSFGFRRRVRPLGRRRLAGVTRGMIDIGRQRIRTSGRRADVQQVGRGFARRAEAVAGLVQRAEVAAGLVLGDGRARRLDLDGRCGRSLDGGGGGGGVFGLELNAELVRHLVPVEGAETGGLATHLVV